MFTHVDDNNKPTMVDVSDKSQTVRVACARAMITMSPELIKRFDGKDLNSKKGPVFNTAIIAATLACKKTSELIPFCHPIFIEDIKIEIKVIDDHLVQIDGQVKTTGKTGVEVEALMAVQIAALTIYDMCKSYGKDMAIVNCHLLSKSGGKSDFLREEI